MHKYFFHLTVTISHMVYKIPTVRNKKKSTLYAFKSLTKSKDKYGIVQQMLTDYYYSR